MCMFVRGAKKIRYASHKNFQTHREIDAPYFFNEHFSRGTGAQRVYKKKITLEISVRR